MSTETKCPQCGGHLISGYGFAFGEGIGVYVVCLDCSHVVGKAVETPGECLHCGGEKGHPPYDLCSPAEEEE